MIWILIAYLAIIYVISRIVSVPGDSGNEAFFRGNRQSAWPLVAYGMIGASVSGVSFVSVPGMVETQGMTYLQTCLGFILGYVLVAFVLLPVYYRLNLTSIYALLEQRLGLGAYRVGAWFFILSDMLGSAVKFFLVCTILQRFVFDELGVSFVLTVPMLVVAIWLYTRRGGVRTLVLTDVLQTTCMLVALCMLVWTVSKQPVFGASGFHLSAIPVFNFSDWTSTQYFWRQFISGAFIVVVMTGLNQNMMQKNLTCKTLKDAQKDMCVSGLLFVPVNALFLLLGAMLLVLGLDAHGDDLLPTFIEQSSMGVYSLLLKSAFVLGIVSAAFSSADSSLTALTTSYCVDIAANAGDERLRRRVHVVMAVVLVAVVYVLQMVGSKSLIDLVYTLVSYTYGPLLGLFALALADGRGRRVVPTSVVWAVCISSPVLCYILSRYVALGYELLLINALLTFLPLKILSRRRE